MNTQDSSTVIDPETYRVSLEMPLKFWWLVRVALDNASQALHREAMAALIEGNISASDVWHRMAMDNDAVYSVVLAMVDAHPGPGEYCQ